MAAIDGRAASWSALGGNAGLFGSARFRPPWIISQGNSAKEAVLRKPCDLVRRCKISQRYKPLGASNRAYAN